jgi:hypothetical protein
VILGESIRVRKHILSQAIYLPVSGLVLRIQQVQQLEESALRRRNQIPAFPRKSKKISLIKAPVCITYAELHYSGWTFVKGEKE